MNLENARENITYSTLEWEGRELRASIQMLTPEEMKAILHQGNKYNRTLSPSHVQKLATKMTNNTWMFNGMPLVFDGDQLLDGQHRANAEIISGKTYPYVIVEGVDPLAFRTIDLPKKRDFATALGIDGENNPKELASAVSWLFLHSVGQASVEIEDKYEQLNNNPSIREAVAQFADIKSVIPKGVSVGFLAATKYLTAQLDAELAEGFFKQVVTGEDTTPNSALLREAIGEIHGMKTADKRHLINSAFRQVWNASRAKKTLDKIKMTLVLADFR